MTNIRTPEDVAAETLEACAKEADKIADELESMFNARPPADEEARDRIAARVRTAWLIAATLRDNRTSIILAVTKPMEG